MKEGKTPQMLLQLSNLEVSYHKKQVIFGLSLTVEAGMVAALVGPNGAGKTTTLNTVIGLLHPRKGEVFFRGENITRQKASENVRRGISLIPQGGRVFPDLSVLENLELGGYLLEPGRLQERLSYVCGLFPILGERQKQRADSLSGGERQMLAIAMALIRQPSVMLFDEPTANLSPKISAEVINEIVKLKDDLGKTILLVEQNAVNALKCGQKALLLVSGRIAFDGESSDLLSSPELGQLYLGLKSQ